MKRNKIRVAYGGAITEAIREADGEARPTGASGRYKVKIIQPGQGSSGIYVAENLAKSAHLFAAGTQMYMNHPSMSEDIERPERSVMDLAGKLVTDAVVGDDGALYAECEVYPSFDTIIFEKWSDIGVSINAWSESEIGADGVVPPFDGVTSVDFVTKAGAGGALLEVLESERTHNTKENQMDKEEIAASISEAVASGIAPLLAAFEEAFPPKKAKDEEDAKKKAEDEERKKKESFDAAVDAASEIAESGLPDVAKARVREAVKCGGDVKALIESEREYIKSVNEPVVTKVTEAGGDEPVIVNFA